MEDPPTFSPPSEFRLLESVGTREGTIRRSGRSVPRSRGTRTRRVPFRRPKVPPRESVTNLSPRQQDHQPESLDGFPFDQEDYEPPSHKDIPPSDPGFESESSSILSPEGEVQQPELPSNLAPPTETVMSYGTPEDEHSTHYGSCSECAAKLRVVDEKVRNLKQYAPGSEAYFSQWKEIVEYVVTQFRPPDSQYPQTYQTSQPAITSPIRNPDLLPDIPLPDPSQVYRLTSAPESMDNSTSENMNVGPLSVLDPSQACELTSSPESMDHSTLENMDVEPGALAHELGTDRNINKSSKIPSTDIDASSNAGHGKLRHMTVTPRATDQDKSSIGDGLLQPLPTTQMLNNNDNSTGPADGSGTRTLTVTPRKPKDWGTENPNQTASPSSGEVDSSAGGSVTRTIKVTPKTDKPTTDSGGNIGGAREDKGGPKYSLTRSMSNGHPMETLTFEVPGQASLKPERPTTHGGPDISSAAYQQIMGQLLGQKAKLQAAALRDKKHFRENVLGAIRSEISDMGEEAISIADFIAQKDPISASMVMPYWQATLSTPEISWFDKQLSSKHPEESKKLYDLINRRDAKIEEYNEFAKMKFGPKPPALTGPAINPYKKGLIDTLTLHTTKGEHVLDSRPTRPSRLTLNPPDPSYSKRSDFAPVAECLSSSAGRTLRPNEAYQQSQMITGYELFALMKATNKLDEETEATGEELIELGKVWERHGNAVWNTLQHPDTEHGILRDNSEVSKKTPHLDDWIRRKKAINQAAMRVGRMPISSPPTVTADQDTLNRGRREMPWIPERTSPSTYWQDVHRENVKIGQERIKEQKLKRASELAIELAKARQVQTHKRKAILSDVFDEARGVFDLPPQTLTEDDATLFMSLSQVGRKNPLFRTPRAQGSSILTVLCDSASRHERVFGPNWREKLIGKKAPQETDTAETSTSPPTASQRPPSETISLDELVKSILQGGKYSKSSGPPPPLPLAVSAAEANMLNEMGMLGKGQDSSKPAFDLERFRNYILQRASQSLQSPIDGPLTNGIVEEPASPVIGKSGQTDLTADTPFPSVTELPDISQ
ncbi:hypothetical protein TREMEDRAFT_62219 [Tremella mesenterica DSM 1558]|uniref:uncharacterized protein n=1 Tax=Tremella mesenterica (strain ATCC 24925 / CBS 8224 / DSM 1558 / NBRC 9311 / NRRL Y-6157 / RJB 2259-6 / UBC 559-6) TaxID=578456 RepID=UPI0003F48E8E|nr:uncharacterized protein TREMEDRAFT_62219 [Tremella mesenterica DSM 1558]EIW69355.1 hypothetical protein TREMEDRAFT_62219 [Tremella mesenterica DSM 1558]